MKRHLMEIVNRRVKLYKEDVKLQLLKLCEEDMKLLGENARAGMKFEMEDMKKW